MKKSHASEGNGPRVTVYRYETNDTPSVTVYRTRNSIIALRGSVLVASARQVPWSEVTASGLWERTKVLAR